MANLLMVIYFRSTHYRSLEMTREVAMIEQRQVRKEVLIKNII